MHLSNSLSSEIVLANSSLFDNVSLFDMAWPALVVLVGGVCAAASVLAKSRLAKRLVPVKVRKQ